jgi:hypothetical protein
MAEIYADLLLIITNITRRNRGPPRLCSEGGEAIQTQEYAGDHEKELLHAEIHMSQVRLVLLQGST